jgi:hypothetical protein
MRPWLYRIAHNTALDLLARRRELPAAELPEPPSRGAPETGALVAALATLPERQRRVYVLRELHGLRIDETAAELGLVATQVEQALFAARNRLAEHLVFGDRLDCVAVRRLSAGPLDRDERRALKTHLRSCGACRTELGVRGRALSALPVLSGDWLRGLAAGLAGGGAPAAAKIGAVVATAGIAAGVPGAMELPRRDVPLLHPAVRIAATPPAPRRAVTPAKPLVTHAAVAVPVVARVVSRPAPSERVSHEAEHAASTTGNEHHPARVAREDHHGSSADGSGDDGSRPSAPAAAAATPDGGSGRPADDGREVQTPAPPATTGSDGAPAPTTLTGGGGDLGSGSSDGGQDGSGDSAGTDGGGGSSGRD